MATFLLRRLACYVVLIAIAASIGYLLAATSLRPRANFAGRNPPPPPAAVDAHLDRLNLNDKTPVLARYGTWVGGVVRGDLGLTVDGTPVTGELIRRARISLTLLLAGTVLGAGLGVLGGVWGAVRHYKLADHAITVSSLLLLSTPVFVLAVLLQIGAVEINNAVGTPIFAYAGEYSPEASGFWPVLGDRLQHLVLPTVTIALGEFAILSRYQRNAMLDVLGADYVRTARAKGLSRRAAVLKHALRTALIPSATHLAYTFGALVTGAAFTEKIFGWHGMGEWVIDSITRNDINAVAAVNLVVAVLVLAAGLGSDLVHALLDPRIRVA